MMQNNEQLAGLSVKDLLVVSGIWCGPEDYLATMNDVRSWSQTAMGRICCGAWRSMCQLWTGTNYDLLRIAPSVLAETRQQA